MKEYFVYIMANSVHMTYIGLTNHLIRRVHEHKTGIINGYTKKYHMNKLVFFESGSDIRAAILREKQIKGWTRARKIQLIEFINPEWNDLSEDWFIT
jgi:putative endonuclease